VDGLARIPAFERAVNDKNWDEAIEQAQSILRQLPDNDSAWFETRPRICRTVAVHEELFQRLVARRPNDVDLWVARAWHFAARRDWARAADAYVQASVKRLRGDARLEYACLLLLLDKHVEYEQFIRECSELSAKNDDQGALSDLARAAGIAPQTAASPAQIIEWAQPAVTANRTSWYLHALALGHYRNREFEEALKVADESNQRDWANQPARAQNWLVMAMAARRLGRSADAEGHLAEALQLIKQFPAAENHDFETMPIPDLLGAEVLLREAEALLGSQAESIVEKKATP
jgi:tetratricopeptide (TPR) repeat protein